MLQVLARERRVARDLARANRALQAEVASRRTAEEEIRTLATELEQRVRDRTVELASSNTALRNENALRQRAQATLESANSNLRHFASFVSHELRQPLATMALWTELLETNPDVGLNERGRGYLKQLRSSIDRMTGFLEAQLRLGARDVHPTHLRGGRRRRRPHPRGRRRRHRSGSSHAGQPSRSATCRPSTPTAPRCAQLFRNLIENAVEVSPSRHPARDPDRGPHHPRATAPATARFASSDNGQGFAESDAEKIFDLFEQLPGRKSAGTGSGVGLAICRRIVEHHGGTIRAEGQPGAGASFIIDLPLRALRGPRRRSAPEVVQT